MIGKVYQSVVDFYDLKTRSTRKKVRPVLIVGGPRNNDYIVLPISTVSKRENLDADYDILIDEAERGVLHLSQECYIRAHKQMPIHQAQLVRRKGDMKADLPDLYLLALEKMERFQKSISEHAL